MCWEASVFGHHAEKDKAMGFCCLSNVQLQQIILLKNIIIRELPVLILMFIGEMETIMFCMTIKMFYISTHQYPFYPGGGTEK